MNDEVTVQIDAGLANVTLARPEQRNRLSKAALEALLAACGALSEDGDTRVVIFRGDGPDFSAGVDLRDDGMRDIAHEPMIRRRRLLQLGPRLVEAIQALPQVTIAAMHGYCLGGGGCVALACDLRIAATDLGFGMPEVLRGMNMSWRTVPLMVAHFGPARTKELLITGRLLDAAQAERWGLANRVVEGSREAAWREADAWAREILDSVPPVPASMVKETVNAVANAATPMVHMDMDQFILTQSTEDFREAVLAFLEKRKPRFTGG
jgi:enoyl-CoA hydratase/carnithine racemase